MNPSTDRQEVRNTLLHNGYNPLPLADKGVYIKGWSRVEITTDWLDQFRRNGRYKNTGIRCDNLVAFDIDVLYEPLADRCEAIVEDLAGSTEFCRIGQWPKRLLLYRLKEGEDTLRSGRTGNYGEHMCELLTTHGRQFAAFGTHPRTGKLYVWEGPSPLDTPWQDLPEIDRETALETLEALEQCLVDTGLPRKRAAHMRGVTGSETWDLTPDTEVMVKGQRIRWGDLVEDLDTEGVFGNLYRPEYDSWGDSDAVHFMLSHGSREPCAHDFVNDCTHYEQPFDPALLKSLLPPPPQTGGTFEPPEITVIRERAVIVADNTVRFTDNPRDALPLSGFRNMNKHLKVRNVATGRQIEFIKQWMEDPLTLRAHRAAMLPHTTDRIVADNGRQILNAYVPPTHDLPGGEIRTFMEFVAHLIPKQAEREILLDWIASKIQHPEYRMHSMVIVTPEFGTGRGTLVQVIEKLLGKSYVVPVELHDLLGTGGQSDFNAFLADSLLISVREAFEQHKDQTKWTARRVAYERVKAISEPYADTMHIKRKYGTNSTEMIYASILIASNHLDALAIEPKDRRVIVLDATETPLTRQGDLFDRMLGWRHEARNIAALHRWMMDRAVSYDPFGEPPMTAAKERMIESGQSEADHLWEAFDDNCEGEVAVYQQWETWAFREHIRLGLDLPGDLTQRRRVLKAVWEIKTRRLDQLPKSGIKIKGEKHRPRARVNSEFWNTVENNGEIVAEVAKNGEIFNTVVRLPTK